MRNRAICVVACLVVLLLGLTLALPVIAQVQSNAGDLVGTVTDPQGARVPGAKVTVRSAATGFERTITTDAEGTYRLLALTPGTYEVSVSAPGFATVQNPKVVVRIGERADFNVELKIATGEQTVIVSTETQLVETETTATTYNITPVQIENLPINQRDYLNFTLLDSSVARDSAPSIGAAPTSGLNFGGQRGRSNLVSVDGADATDNSVNGVRSTVSQEAVQEFQIVTNSYMPEFGRASGGVVNIVTKHGGNDIHGNLFGFIRNRHFEARNAFSNVSDPAFTRFEGGVTLGGPIVKDKTFYFLSYERRQRREEGFSSIGANNFELESTSIPGIPIPLLMTPAQAGFVNAVISNPFLNAAFGPINPLDGINTPLEKYILLAAGGADVAVNGCNNLLNVLLGGSPTSCNPLLGGSFPTSLAPLPVSFTRLSALEGNYPVKEDTDFFSARLDHQFNPSNNFFVRVNVTPSDITGIQVNAQNQTFGQNSFSRTSTQSFRDIAVVAQNTTLIGTNWVNEARFQFARRGLSYTPSPDPGNAGEPLGGEGLGVDIGGFAHFGREPFSRVDRVERRWQWSDNVSFAFGRHTMKFGTDINFIQVRPRYPNKQVFELNFGGTMRFGALEATALGFPSSVGPLLVPAFNAVQAYGMGLPSSLVQGIGDSFSQFNNTALAFYIQDSWRATPRLTVNYGLRWEGEATPLLPAFNDLTARAEAALGVREGIPRDWNNFQPRLGLAWDPWGDGKTAVRASYGIFFDHPLLALAFNSDTADGAQSTQQIIAGGSPCAPTTSILTNPTCLNATNIFQGILNTSAGGLADPFNFGYLPDQQRFNPFQPNSIFVNQNFCPQPSPDPTRQCVGFPLPILPFTLPVARDFVFAYAQQWDLSIEREIAHDFSFKIGYLGVKGSHLNRPRNINAPDAALLVANFNNALAIGLPVSGNTPLGVGVPSRDPVTMALLAPGTCFNTASGSLLLNIPGIFGTAFDVANCGGGLVAPIGFIGTAAAFNFFRPSGPNFALTGGVGVPDAAILAAATAANYPLGPGFFVPFSDVNQQESSGSSLYHGMTVSLRKRFGNHYEFLGSYTWSHAIDDSTDLQTLLNPQNNNRPDLERGNSTFDLRHRFVFSAVIQTPYSRSDQSFWKKFLADFTFSPIFQAASGRPFSALTGVDSNLDFGPFTDRPSVVSGSPLVVQGVPLGLPDQCPSTSTALTGVAGCYGSLGRNTFFRPATWQLDLRVARKIYFGERLNLDLIADVFNLFNRFNVADVNQLCDPFSGDCIAGQPTAAGDARQFQFGLKLNW